MKKSLKGYRWRRSEQVRGCAEDLVKSLGISPTLADLLSRRGICSKERAEEFLNPSLKHLNDPFFMRDMKEAVERVIRAVRERERIMIHGDYDADGITSTALLYLALRRVGVKPEVYLPRRGVEGYGLSPTAVEEAVKRGVDLIITVDCGSTAHMEVEMAGDEGIDVVITDHHEVTHPLPQASAVVNPRRRDDLYPFKDLAGVGVAFKLLQGLEKRGLPVQPLKDLDLVAIGTLADVVPLVEENRTLVVEGLKRLPFTEKAGLQELLKEGRIDLSRPTTTRDVVFSIAPRINVPGRMGNPMLAFELLTTESPLEAELYMMELLKEEKKKQAAVERITKEVMERVKEDDWVVVEAGEGWEEGVLGIVANRILERFGVPTIILTLVGGEARGSARAPPSIDIIEALMSASGLNMDFGGHQHAAGIRLPADQVDSLRSSLAEYVKSRFRRQDLRPELVIDGDITPEEITEEFVEDVEKLAPFGTSNPPPVFRLTLPSLPEDYTIRGNSSSHLFFWIPTGAGKVECTAFSFGDFMDELMSSRKNIELAVTPHFHYWGVTKRVRLNVVDIKVDLQG